MGLLKPTALCSQAETPGLRKSHFKLEQTAVADRCTTLPFSKYTNRLNSLSCVAATPCKFQTVAQTSVCESHGNHRLKSVPQEKGRCFVMCKSIARILVLLL